ncbi:unnamed protein product [Lactuca virosa]|uniref:Uncharacterized protein n=1 Tax=Lactuca virosa TaxID=75947 RepID=A0AAU9LSE6_9ASTR|nr:unnamed protein product [Lactuca virosa]
METVRVKERWQNKNVIVTFHRAKGVLDQLENKEVVEVENKDDDDKKDHEAPKTFFPKHPTFNIVKLHNIGGIPGAFVDYEGKFYTRSAGVA